MTSHGNAVVGEYAWQRFAIMAMLLKKYQQRLIYPERPLGYGVSFWSVHNPIGNSCLYCTYILVSQKILQVPNPHCQGLNPKGRPEFVCGTPPF